MISVRIGSLQRAALECHAPQDHLDDLEIVGDRLVVTDTDKTVSILIEASNSADEQHERDGLGVDGRMADALARLASRVRRAA